MILSTQQETILTLELVDLISKRVWDQISRDQLTKMLIFNKSDWDLAEKTLLVSRMDGPLVVDSILLVCVPKYIGVARINPQQNYSLISWQIWPKPENSLVSISETLPNGNTN